MFNDIKLVADEKVKNIQTFNIKCYSDEEFLKIKEFFKTKKKSNEVIKVIKEILI